MTASQSAVTTSTFQKDAEIRWLQTPKGKGKVLAAKSGHGAPAIPRLAGVTSLDAQHGTHEGDFRPRYPAATAVSWIPVISLDHPTQGYEALEAMRSSQPCLMRKSPLVIGLQGRWTLQHLEKVMQECCGSLTVLCSASRQNRFVECDDGKNLFGSYYHVREPESQRLGMSFPEFAQCAQRWQARQLFLREALMIHNGCSANSFSKQSVRAQLRMAEPLGTGLQTELEGRIDWLWLHSLLHAQRHGSVLRVELQAGPPDGLLPARYECVDRLLAQVTGRRRILLLPPSQAFEGLYPYPVHHPYDRYSMVDFDAVNAEEWPGFGGVCGASCILEPGDLLFVPQFWFAHVQFLDAENIDLVFYLHPGARIRAPASVPLQVSRLLEERLGEAEGVKDVRHWLSLIERDGEDTYIDAETVQGYRRVVLCEGVRDEIGANLWPTPAVAQQLLRGMVDRRLMPTPWLNQNFREPLYLKDKPVRIEDTRTDEERKYPQLFRTKLEGEGWQVPASVSTVPIPGYNMPKGQDYRQL